MMVKRGKGSFDATVTDDAGVEHEVSVTWHGYSDPGKLYGPPENCYPPEGEVEITVTGLPLGVEVSEDEHERLEEEAWAELAQQERYRYEEY